MQPGQASRTIYRVAVLRAAHQILDESPRIFEDPIAVGLTPDASEAQIRAAAGDIRQPLQSRLRSMTLLRSRFVEDELAVAVARGVRQYTILGAGLDTYPWRQPVAARALRIFHTDHPATMAVTDEVFRKRGLTHSSNLVRAGLDLEAPALGARLAAMGFDGGAPAFFSMLGLMQYLSHGALDAIFELVAALPRGSAVAFSFNPPDSHLADGELEEARRSQSRGRSLGEPWLSRPAPAELMVKLGALGFGRVFHLAPELAQRRYFGSRSDGLAAPIFEQLMIAEV